MATTDPATFVSNVWQKGLFAERVVFCTGGGGTICSGLVKALVYLGADACIVGRNVEKTEAMAEEIASVRQGARVMGIGKVDVRSLDSLAAAVQKCVDQLGGIDFAIAGAAGNFLAPIAGLSSNAFRTVVEIDLIGSYNTVKAAMPHLLESAARNKNPGTTTGGRIIFISATFHYTGMPLLAHVSAAKAGVDALAASVALEYGPSGVTSNVISPGGIEGTEGMERLSSRAAREAGLAAKVVPLGRLGLVKEISDATVYLFSEAGNFVNGHVLVVDGAAWRLPAGVLGAGEFQYPDILLSKLPDDIKKGRKSRL